MTPWGPGAAAALRQGAQLSHRLGKPGGTRGSPTSTAPATCSNPHNGQNRALLFVQRIKKCSHGAFPRFARLVKGGGLTKVKSENGAGEGALSGAEPALEQKSRGRGAPSPCPTSRVAPGRRSNSSALHPLCLRNRARKSCPASFLSQGTMQTY